MLACLAVMMITDPLIAIPDILASSSTASKKHRSQMDFYNTRFTVKMPGDYDLNSTSTVLTYVSNLFDPASAPCGIAIFATFPAITIKLAKRALPAPLLHDIRAVLLVLLPTDPELVEAPQAS